MASESTILDQVIETCDDPTILRNLLRDTRAALRDVTRELADTQRLIQQVVDCLSKTTCLTVLCPGPDLGHETTKFKMCAICSLIHDLRCIITEMKLGNQLQERHRQ